MNSKLRRKTHGWPSYYIKPLSCIHSSSKRLPSERKLYKIQTRSVTPQKPVSRVKQSQCRPVAEKMLCLLIAVQYYVCPHCCVFPKGYCSLFHFQGCKILGLRKDHGSGLKGVRETSWFRFKIMIHHHKINIRSLGWINLTLFLLRLELGLFYLYTQLSPKYLLASGSRLLCSDCSVVCLGAIK